MLSAKISLMRIRTVTPFAYKVIGKQNRGAVCKLLDIGCGDYMPRFVQDHLPNIDYWGIDIRGNCGTNFRERHKFQQIDIMNSPLPFENNSFDVILMSHVLEHLTHYAGVLKECHRVLRPNGLLYIETPNPRMLFLPSMQGTLNFYDDVTHIRPFTRSNLLDLLKHAGFDVIACKNRRDVLWILVGIPSVLFKRMFMNQPLYGGYFWDLFGCVVYTLGRKPATHGTPS